MRKRPACEIDRGISCNGCDSGMIAVKLALDACLSIIFSSKVPRSIFKLQIYGIRPRRKLLANYDSWRALNKNTIRWLEGSTGVSTMYIFPYHFTLY